MYEMWEILGMTIQTKIICDHCKQEIKDLSNIAFTITSMIIETKLEMHFCKWQCMKIYLESKWPKSGFCNNQT